MATTAAPIPYSADVEKIPADEAANILKITESVKQLLASDTLETGKFRGDVHVKTHGYAKGRLTIAGGLPDELAQGLFAQPAGYPVVVRFSNSASFQQPDAVPDGRGMAIKVMGVPGDLLDQDQDQPSQDFVLINHPVFFAADAQEFLRLQTARADANANPLAAHKALTGGNLNPLTWHWGEIMKLAEIAGQPPRHPASYSYYSMSPLRYGNFVAKVRVVPHGKNSESWLQMLLDLATENDAMRLALEKTLLSEAIQFDFQVQLRTSEQSMPIEDATVQWPEDESPYQTVAQLELPQQDIESLRQQESFQNLAFNVWHGLVEHRPLGGINRIRKQVYPLSAKWRRKNRS